MVLAGGAAGTYGRPAARLEITPNPADLGENVKFDATSSFDSHGRIEKYFFDFDNDGVYDKLDYDGVVYKRFTSSGSRTARLKVVDDHGRVDTTTAHYRVRSDLNSCEIYPGFLYLEDGRIREDESTDAYIDVYNQGEGQRVRATFKVNGVTVAESRKYLSSGETVRFSTSVSPDGNAEVRVFVDTINGPCGTKELFEDREQLDVVKVPEEAHLDVLVVDQNEDAVANARVDIRDHNGALKYTRSNGKTSFALPPGIYRVEASKDRYTAADEQVELEDGETETLKLKIKDKTDRASLKVSAEDKRGEALRDTRIIVSNGEDHTRYTDFEGETSFTLSSGEYEVAAYKPGYEVVQRKVGLEAGEHRSMSFELSRHDSYLEEARLQIHVEDEDGDPLENARIEATDGDFEIEYTDDDGDAEFELEPGFYRLRVSKNRYRTEYRTVDLEEGDYRSLDFELEGAHGYLADLRVKVEDGDGDELRNARVEVENSERRVQRTDFDGEAWFRLDPDRYDVTVSKSGYTTEDRSVRLSRGEHEIVRFRLEESDTERDLFIARARTPATVCRGDDLDITVRVTNDGNTDEHISLGARGLGDVAIVRFELESGESRERTLTLRNAEGSGIETLRIAVSNSESHVITRDVKVNDCNGGTTPRTRPSAISLQITPQETQVGKMVRVSGYVDGVNGRSNVDISVNGRSDANIATQPDGYYQAYVRMREAGSAELVARSGDRTARQQVNVLPTVETSSMNAPRKVFENDRFEICSNVESQLTPLVVLKRNGERIASKNARGEVCFDTEAQDPGTTVYTVLASARGVQDSETRKVEVLELDDEVESFPEKVTMVRSGDGLVRVRLYNTQDSPRRYDLQLEGVPSGWFDKTDETVVLSQGERKAVYFYITPKAEGRFTSLLTVEADGNVIHSQEILINSGGTTETRRGLIDRMLSLLML